MGFLAAAKVLRKAKDARVKLAGGKVAYDEEIRLKKKREKEGSMSSTSSLTSQITKLSVSKDMGSPVAIGNCHSVDTEACGQGSNSGNNRHHNLALLPTSQGVREYSSLKGIVR
jgi:3-deoxy-D-manno-octulosonic acid (KDO) 8-phosphate synthase